MLRAGEERRHPDGPDDGRSPFERDRDRVLYTSALRRLAETTQVMPAQSGHVYHNRLTHTLEVAQLARRIAERLGRENPGAPALPDPDASEAAAWAHDLGHPPFGHTGEAALDAALRERWPGSDGYEGNAQSFRVVVRLAVRNASHPGLNLTRRTLRGVLKYPWMRGERPGHKFGAYRAEQVDFEWAAGGVEGPCLEAQVVDAADDVAYSVHDLFDFTRAGLIPLHRLREPGDEFHALAAEAGIGHAEAGALHAATLARYPLDRPFDGSRNHRAALREFTTGLIADLARRGMRLGPAGLERTPQTQSALALLQQATVRFVLNEPSLAAVKEQQRRLVRALVGHFADPANLPVAAREQLEAGQPPDRAAADAVAAMTEAEAESCGGMLGLA